MKHNPGFHPTAKTAPALIDGGSVSVLALGPPGRGKAHFLAALGRKLISRYSKRVLFRPAFKLVGHLSAARQQWGERNKKAAGRDLDGLQ
jgi:DNA replication protein DnaC